MKGQERIKALESTLAIIAGLLVFGFIFENVLLHKIAAVVGVTALFIKAFSKYLSIAWLKLSEGLGFVSSKIILSAVFYVFLAPISFVYRLTGGASMIKKPDSKSFFSDRNHSYTSEDFDKLW